MLLEEQWYVVTTVVCTLQRWFLEVVGCELGIAALPPRSVVSCAVQENSPCKLMLCGRDASPSTQQSQSLRQPLPSEAELCESQNMYLRLSGDCSELNV